MKRLLQGPALRRLAFLASASVRTAGFGLAKVTGGTMHLSLRRLAVAGLTAIGLPLGLMATTASTAGAAAPAQPTPATTARTATPASALMAAQIPLVRAADTIRKAATSGPSGYTNLTLSVPKHQVTVYWTGTMPGRLTRLFSSLRSAKVSIVVRPAQHTAAQVMAEVRRLEASRARYAAQGIFLDSFIPRADGSGIAVGISSRAGFRPAKARIRAELSTGPLIPLTFQPASKLTTTHRLEDLPSHWAGSRIVEVNGPESCTTGFPMQRRSDGRTFITTSDHCDANVGHPVNEQWWDWLGPHDINHRMGEAWYHTASLDIAYIRPPNGWVQGVTYDGGVAESHDFNKSVVGVAGNYDGNYVCDSGSWTGVHCSIQTQYSGSFWISEDNSYVTLWVGNQTGGGIANGAGDSGGPVFTLGSLSNTVVAAGSITGSLDQGFGCVNDNGESDTCYNTVVWVDEQSILNNLGANILTN